MTESARASTAHTMKSGEMIPAFLSGSSRRTIKAKAYGLGFLAVVLMFLTYQNLNRIHYTGSRRSQTDEEQLRAAKAIEAAGNRTLGFHAIKYINLDTRYDKLDAASVGAYLANIDLDIVPGVDQTKTNFDKGFPPTSRPGGVRQGEIGCWRAHANIWSEIVRKQLPPTLIMESDAVWDVNLRSEMKLLNKHFTELLYNLGVDPLYNGTAPREPTYEGPGEAPKDASKPWWKPGPNHTADHPDQPDLARHKRAPTTSEDAPAAPSYPLPTPDPDDPWLSDYWDLISLGQCTDQRKADNRYLRYTDPYAPERSFDYWDVPLTPRERVVHQSGGPACTNAYAITHRGAAKLLLRGAISLDAPVDLMIKSMVMNGELTVYSVMPTIMAQWRYRQGLSTGGGGSDINPDVEGHFGVEAGEAVSWDDVWRDRSVWETVPFGDNMYINEMTLTSAWDKLFSNDRALSEGYS